MSQTAIVVYRHEINNNFSQLLGKLLHTQQAMAFYNVTQRSPKWYLCWHLCKKPQKKAIKKTEESQKEKW